MISRRQTRPTTIVTGPRPVSDKARELLHETVERCQVAVAVKDKIAARDLRWFQHASEQLRVESPQALSLLRAFMTWHLLRVLVSEVSNLNRLRRNAGILHAWRGMAESINQRAMEPTDNSGAQSLLDDARIQTATSIVASEYHKAALSATRVAHRLGMSVSHFGRRFKAATGYTFSDYLKLVRLRAALLMLSHTHLQVRDVAEAAGYSHVSTFDRDFRQLLGVSPRAMRTCLSMEVTRYVSCSQGDIAQRA